jgi:hypothetical protein
MRRYVLLLGLATLLVVGAAGIADAAGGEGPISILMPETELSVNDGFIPKALSKSEPTPVSFLASGEIKELDGSHPPALRELTMEFEKTIGFHVDGIPACPRRLLGETTETAAARKACRSALIGEGEVIVQVAYPETEMPVLHSKLLVFKGGESDGTTTLLIHAYLANPISSAIVVPVTVAKHRSGPFGTRAIAKVPQIAGGGGSITGFDLRIFRSVGVAGGRVNPISASCPEGKLRVLSLGTFEDGTKMQTEVIRACTAKG